MTEQSIRAMYVLKYLWRKADDEHPATTADIVNGVAEYGISVNRHAIPAIIEQLEKFGADIVEDGGSPNKYFIGSRGLELTELKLLVDAVESSRFISENKSNKLVKMLCVLASEYQVEELNRHLYIDGKIKSDNKALYLTVDILHKAINSKKICFQYLEYTLDKKKIYKHKGYIFEFYPYAMLWHNDCYYALGYSEKHQTITKFRVDRMDKATILDTAIVQKPSI